MKVTSLPSRREFEVRARAIEAEVNELADMGQDFEYMSSVVVYEDSEGHPQTEIKLELKSANGKHVALASPNPKARPTS